MSARGSLGYVAAAFELSPPPARIYVPLGSGTTVCGLLAGLALRDARTEVVAVRVLPSPVTGRRMLRIRARGVLRWLRRHGAEVPAEAVEHVPLRVVSAEGRYGEPTAAVRRAIEAARPVPLEPTYSGKALAALLADRSDGAMLLATWAGPPGS
jgi:D-cysteine desulfhydrase